MKSTIPLSLVVAWVITGSVRADRCVGPKDFSSAVTQYGIGTYAQSDIVWCDDFDTYCTANDSVIPGGVWPGYPPSPDNLCATDAIASNSWFRNVVYHWPPDGYTGGTQMAIENGDPFQGWDDALGWPTMPFLARQEGGANTTQYHTFDLAGAVGHKYPGANAVNGTDTNPLILRWWVYAPGSGVYQTTPHYLELRLDDDRAPTDYVEWDCGFRHECNCYWSNTDATCNAGVCENVGACTQGTCNLGVCDADICIIGLRIGQPCTVDGDCNQCDGGANTDCPNGTNLECGSVCVGGTNNGNLCTSNADCAGSCTGGAYPGQACTDNNDCGACVGGNAAGAQCEIDHDCQYQCGAGQTPACDGGTHDGQACTDETDCFGGPVFPVVNQIEYNYLIPSCPPTAPCTPAEGLWPAGPSNGYVIDPSPGPGLSIQVHASIAFGWFPHANEQGAAPGLNPCDLANGRKPTNYHAQTFDGNRWRDLRSNKYLPGYGDFNFLGSNSGQGFFQITIMSSYYFLKLTGPIKVNDQIQVVDNEATLARVYTGRFNKVSMGTSPGCRLSADGTCATTADVYRYPSFVYNRLNNVRWAVAYIDRPVLLGGVGISSEGACCDKDAQCSIASNEGACTDGTCASDVCAGGPHDGEPCTNNYDCYGSFAGIGTTCPENPEDYNPCCPLVWADIDRDGDVDQSDFNQFQLCFSGTGVAAPPECHCWNRNPDTNSDVDAGDYAAFTPCWTGPNVPYNLLSLPTGCE